MQEIIRIISESAEEPISLEMAKKYMRIQSSSDDILIAQLIRAARQYAEKYTGLSIISKIIALTIFGALPETVPLAYPPVISIAKVQCADQDGNISIMDPSNYYWKQGSDYLMFYRCPYCLSTEIQYTAGYSSAYAHYSDSTYADPGAVPQDIKNGMLRHVFALYQNRGDIVGNDTASISRESYKQYRTFKIAGHKL